MGCSPGVFISEGPGVLVSRTLSCRNVGLCNHLQARMTLGKLMSKLRDGLWFYKGRAAQFRARVLHGKLFSGIRAEMGRRHCCTSDLLWSYSICFLGTSFPTNRIATWAGNAGVQGGIPNVTTIFTNLTPANSLADINNAINRCPSNQVVMLGAGTYNLSGGITIIQRNGVVLRGQGTNTLLVFNGTPYLANILIEGDFRSAIWNGTDGLVNWTEWLRARHSSNLVLASTSGLTRREMHLPGPGE